MNKKCIFLHTTNTQELFAIFYHPYTYNIYKFVLKLNPMQKLYIGPALIRHRMALGFSQADLSAYTGISQSQISRIESNKQMATLTQITRISEALGVPATMLYPEDDCGHPEDPPATIFSLQAQLLDLRALLLDAGAEIARLKAKMSR